MASIADEMLSLVQERKNLEQVKVKKPSRTIVMSVASQKGGVGKTSSTVNIAACLATKGLKTLVIDFDPQSNATTALNVPNHDIDSVYELLSGDSDIQNTIIKSAAIENLFILPASIDLSGFEIELTAGEEDREYRLKQAIEPLVEQNTFDYILIDTPPSLGLLNLNALTASEFVLIPVQSEYYALEGLTLLLKTVELVQANLNSKLRDPFFIITMFDSRNNLSKDVEHEIKDNFKDKYIEPKIPRSVRISEAPSNNQTIIEYDKNSVGAVRYLELAVNLNKAVLKVV